MFWFCAPFLRLRLFVRHILGVSSSARGVAGLPERRIANFGVLGSIGTRKLFRSEQPSCTKYLRCEPVGSKPLPFISVGKIFQCFGNDHLGILLQIANQDFGQKSSRFQICHQNKAFLAIFVKIYYLLPKTSPFSDTKTCRNRPSSNITVH